MATIYKRQLTKGESWTLQDSVKGKRFRRSLGFITEKEAKLALLEYEAGVTRKVPESVNVPYFEDYAEDYKTWHAKKHPDSYVRIAGIIDQHLTPYLKGTTLDQINLKQIETYCDKRLRQRARPSCRTNTKSISPATINKEVVTLKAVLNRAIKLDIITKHNLKAWEKLSELDSKVITYFTPTELDLLYDDQDHGQLWRLMANTGMRRAEAMHLTWSDINDLFIQIKSTKENRTKSKKARVIALGKQNKRALLDIWRKTSGDPTAKHYPVSGGRVIPYASKDTLSNYAKEAINNAGLSGSLHKFRHTYISNLAMNNVSVIKIQQMAGHATIGMTMRYMHLSPDYLADVGQYS